MTKTQLTEEQQKAVEFKDGACSVIAGAGAGKTVVLVERVRNLVKKHGVSPSDILTISFTRNASDELNERLSKLGLSDVHAGTFHSICGDILRREGLNLGRNLIRKWQIENIFKKVDKSNGELDIDDILGFISFQKNRGIGVNDKYLPKESKYSLEELESFFKTYEGFKNSKGLYDFDDYLILALETMRKFPDRYTFKYVLIDEHQDTNGVQNEILQYWAGKDNNIFAVFDARQAIYGFRGGDIKYSMNFEDYWDNPTTYNVTKNFRSSKNIVEKSNGFIRPYFVDFEHYKDAVPHKQENGIVETHYNDTAISSGIEAGRKVKELVDSGIEPRDIAVLYRNNNQADYIENELKSYDIEYDIAGDGSFFKRREIDFILSVMRLINDSDDDSALESILKMRVEPLKFLPNTDIQLIRKQARETGMAMYDAVDYVSFSNSWQNKNLIDFKQKISRLSTTYADMDAFGEMDLKVFIDAIINTFNLKKHINDTYLIQEDKTERLVSLELLKRFTGNMSMDGFIDYAYGDTQKKESKENSVKLMSVHRSKGLEFDHVILIGVEDGQFPSARADDVSEEARLFYVAVTRAKKNMWIYANGFRSLFVEQYNNPENGEQLLKEYLEDPSANVNRFEPDDIANAKVGGSPTEAMTDDEIFRSIENKMGTKKGSIDF